MSSASQNIDKIPSELARAGFCVIPGFLDQRSVSAAAEEMRELIEAGDFSPAGIGNRTKHRTDEAIRRDRIHWFEPDSMTDIQKGLLASFEELRLVCNRELFLGLNDLEGHYAVYEPGAFYLRHKDAFNDDDSRVLSIVLYLNETWQPGNGGELRLHTPPESVTIEPRGGTLVTFLSQEVEHEVLESYTVRRSFAGWFKKRQI